MKVFPGFQIIALYVSRSPLTDVVKYVVYVPRNEMVLIISNKGT